jgi:hypothetical protein
VERLATTRTKGMPSYRALELALAIYSRTNGGNWHRYRFPVKNETCPSQPISPPVSRMLVQENVQSVDQVDRRGREPTDS